MAVYERKLRNFLLQPLLQIRLGLYAIALALAFCLTLGWMFYSNFHRFYELVLELTDLRDDVEALLQTQMRGAMLWFGLALLIYFLGTVILSVFFTHKLVGPTYAFRRQIRELQSGNYGARVVLRKGDAFHEVAEELNQLAVTLEQNRRG